MKYLLAIAIIPLLTSAQRTASADDDQRMVLKTETFDRDPGWLGVNHRSAQTHEPRRVRQDFGFSPDSSHAGGTAPGEIGGFVTPAGEAAFYGKAITPVSLDQPLSAAGTMSVGTGGTNLLLGFFNSKSINEWRTPNTIAIRLNGRGETFFAYVEYCTSNWRAGGDTTPFPSTTDPQTGRKNLIGYPGNKSVHWSLSYDPTGNQGKGEIKATIGADTASCRLDETHQTDGARFTHFGILNVIKSVDFGSEIWFDDITINGMATESFTHDPHWEGMNNRKTKTSRMVRPWFDFGFSDTHFAGGRNRGELGGLIYRGDCRYPERMACYGDAVGPLTLDKPLQARGKVTMTRGVTDSTTLFGFYHSSESMRHNESQADSVPDSVLGIHLEGPSSEGFLFYPVVRSRGGSGLVGHVREFPTIRPNKTTHDWNLDYNPDGAGGKGQITITLDQHSKRLDLREGDKRRGTSFDRFGIVTSWIDGNGQTVYWDDITYTAAQ